VKISPRMRNVLIPCAVIIPLVAGLLIFCFMTEMEPLTPQEMLDKKQWTRNELVDGLARSLSPQAHRGQRRKVMAHLKKHMKQFTPDKRKQIRIEAMRRAINNSLDQLRAVKPEARKKMIKVIQQRAEKNYKRVKKLNRTDKERIKKRINSEEGQAVIAEMNRIMTSRLSADERRDFAPITKIWLNTLDKL
jgi:hypothetical protein